MMRTANPGLSEKLHLLSEKSSLLGSHLQLYARIENDSVNHKMRSGRPLKRGTSTAHPTAFPSYRID